MKEVIEKVVYRGVTFLNTDHKTFKDIQRERSKNWGNHNDPNAWGNWEDVVPTGFEDIMTEGVYRGINVKDSEFLKLIQSHASFKCSNVVDMFDNPVNLGQMVIRTAKTKNSELKLGKVVKLVHPRLHTQFILERNKVTGQEIFAFCNHPANEGKIKCEFPDGRSSTTDAKPSAILVMMPEMDIRAEQNYKTMYEESKNV